jgi:hypothetical protein
VRRGLVTNQKGQQAVNGHCADPVSVVATVHVGRRIKKPRGGPTYA